VGTLSTLASLCSCLVSGVGDTERVLRNGFSVSALRRQVLGLRLRLPLALSGSPSPPRCGQAHAWVRASISTPRRTPQSRRRTVASTDLGVRTAQHAYACVHARTSRRAGRAQANGVAGRIERARSARSTLACPRSPRARGRGAERYGITRDLHYTERAGVGSRMRPREGTLPHAPPCVVGRARAERASS